MKTEPAVTVKYVNAPKNNGPANIKDDKNVVYKFWITSKGKNKGFPLSTFKEGGTYTIGYEIQPSSQYGDQYFIQEVQDITGSQLAAPATNGAAHVEESRHTNNRDAERMSCNGWVNAGIQAGQIQFTVTDLVSAIGVARDAWRQTFGKQ